jgi:anhydro-N-acetylmuramic acid kinase
VLQHASCGFDAALRAELLALNTTGGQDELHRAALAANALVRHYAQVVQQLLQQRRAAGQIAAIGAHGQTVRHRPQMFDGTGYTLQLNSPALLAELTGITVVADLRSRDVAAAARGAAGAGLSPACSASPGNGAGAQYRRHCQSQRAGADGSVLGFDTGTGNALMDGWCLRHTGSPMTRRPVGRQRQGPAQLLAAMLADPIWPRAAQEHGARSVSRRLAGAASAAACQPGRRRSMCRRP